MRVVRLLSQSLAWSLLAAGLLTGCGQSADKGALAEASASPAPQSPSAEEERQAQVYAALVHRLAASEPHGGKATFIQVGTTATDEGDPPQRISEPVQRRIAELLPDLQITWVDGPAQAYDGPDMSTVKDNGILVSLGTLKPEGSGFRAFGGGQVGNVGGNTATYLITPAPDGGWQATIAPGSTQGVS